MENATLKYQGSVLTFERFQLEVVEGPDRGKTFDIPFSGERLLVGTNRGCSIQLADPHVSRRHFALAAQSEYLELHDLHSSNGTAVNGVRIMECHLRGGEAIQIGATSIRVVPKGAEPSPAEPTVTNFGRMVGCSRSMGMVFGVAARLAQTDVALVIEGESGVGKELLAECIHEAGPRREGPFIVFDPAETSEPLMLRSLLGAEANAMTGFPLAHKGLFELADGGTLLIDAPADLPLDLQRKLLRVLDRQEVTPVGASQGKRVNVRVITTTNDDLDKAVEEGRLREDLFFRLCGARIEVPPLRKRREDIGLLMRHLGGPNLSPELIGRYEQRAWPGNVRELQGAVATYLAAGTIDVAEGADNAGLQDSFGGTLGLNLPMPQAKQRLMSNFEAAYVERLLTKHRGNVSRAAAESGLAYRYFQLLKARHKK